MPNDKTDLCQKKDKHVLKMELSSGERLNKAMKFVTFRFNWKLCHTREIWHPMTTMKKRWDFRDKKLNFLPVPKKWVGKRLMLKCFYNLNLYMPVFVYTVPTTYTKQPFGVMVIIQDFSKHFQFHFIFHWKQLISFISIVHTLQRCAQLLNCYYRAWQNPSVIQETNSLWCLIVTQCHVMLLANPSHQSIVCIPFYNWWRFNWTSQIVIHGEHHTNSQFQLTDGE